MKGNASNWLSASPSTTTILLLTLAPVLPKLRRKSVSRGVLHRSKSPILKIKRTAIISERTAVISERTTAKMLAWCRSWMPPSACCKQVRQGQTKSWVRKCTPGHRSQPGGVAVRNFPNKVWGSNRALGAENRHSTYPRLSVKAVPPSR